MKTKNLFRFTFLLIAALAFTLYSCKKDKTETKTTNTKTDSMQQLTKDEANIEDAADQASNDAVTYMSGGALKNAEIICGATANVDTLIPDTLTVHIVYNGWNCPHTRYRTGEVQIRKKMGESWGSAGTKVLVYTINFHVIKLNLQQVTLNGRKMFENVTGGYIYELGGLYDSIIHKESGYMTALFEDNSSRVWYMDRQRKFFGIPNMDSTEMALSGFGAADGYTNLITWGTNRNSEPFYTQITTPVVHKQACDGNPCSGVMVFQIPAASESATVTFGYDDLNNLITDGSCPSRYRVDWTVNGNSGTFFLPLP